ncbi:MAG TPA: hypothetical protein VGC98_05215 [Thermoleophilaceae bacterium]|jgi:hypothetical protein
MDEPTWVKEWVGDYDELLPHAEDILHSEELCDQLFLSKLDAASAGWYLARADDVVSSRVPDPDLTSMFDALHNGALLMASLDGTHGEHIDIEGRARFSSVDGSGSAPETLLRIGVNALNAVDTDAGYISIPRRALEKAERNGDVWTVHHAEAGTTLHLKITAPALSGEDA